MKRWGVAVLAFALLGCQQARQLADQNAGGAVPPASVDIPVPTMDIGTIPQATIAVPPVAAGSEQLTVTTTCSSAHLVAAGWPAGTVLHWSLASDPPGLIPMPDGGVDITFAVLPAELRGARFFSWVAWIDAASGERDYSGRSDAC